MEPEIPTAMPRYRASALTLPANPSISVETEPMISELFGDWKIDVPNEAKPR